METSVVVIGGFAEDAPKQVEVVWHVGTSVVSKFALATLRADPKRKQANIKRFMQPMAKNDSFYFFRAITRDHRKFVPKKMLEGLLSSFLRTVSSARSRVMKQIGWPKSNADLTKICFLNFLLPESVIIMVSEMPLLCRTWSSRRRIQFACGWERGQGQGQGQGQACTPMASPF